MSYEMISRLFKASGHEARIEILKALEERGKPAKFLAELLNTSEPYIHRHLQILSKEGLIRRDGKNLVLSASGRIFVNLIDGFEVLAKYKGFWEGHSIDGIPADMLKDLRVLKNTELVHPAYEVINKAIETISTAEERILITVDKPVKMAIPTLHEVVDKGVEAYLVGTTVPPEFSELGMHALMEHENVKIRITPDIYMGVSVLDNREAGMILPDLQGSLDWNYAIYGKDPEFITWVERAFWNMYKKGEVLKIEK